MRKLSHSEIKVNRKELTNNNIIKEHFIMKYLFIILTLFFPQLLFGQLVNDFRVNTDTALSIPKYFAKVSSNKNENTVVAWIESGNVYNAYAQVFDKYFNRIGNNIKINNTIPATTADVAVRRNGSFGIVWATYTYSNPNGSRIFLNIYDKYGVPILQELQINDTIKEFNPRVSISCDDNDRFIIAFDNPASNNYLFRPDIFFQIVDSNGFKIGRNVKVNQNISFGKPVIGVKKDGGFAISWWGSLENYMTNIYCQLFSPIGTPIGNNQQVNDIETGIDTLDYQELPDIAVDSAGNYTIGFKETPYSSGVARIKYQRFNKNGNKIGINKIIDAGFYDFQFSSDEVGNLIFLFSAGGPSGFLYNLRIDKNDNQIGNYFLASNQFPNIGKAGNDIVLINKKFINLWRDLRLSNQPQLFLNVRSYTNPDSVVSVNNISSEIPSLYSLGQNYPNPFNPSTKIRFDVSSSPLVPLQRGILVVLKVYDIMGREVVTLVNENLKPGTYETSFSGDNFPSGIYFYRLQIGEYSETKKMSLIK